MTKPSLGLNQESLDTIQKEVSVVIHAASTLNLKKKLPYMVKHVIEPSVEIANVALKCETLSRFVFISTAYVNTILRSNKDGISTGFDTFITEKIHPIIGPSNDNPNTELDILISTGTTPQYESVRHVAHYTYAKHLAERLIEHKFNSIGQVDRLLIVRPSGIGPAELLPHEFYEKPTSVPGSMLAAGIVLSPPKSMKWSCNLPDTTAAQTDEVPVDVVVNRVVVHTAVGTSGCVHAVAGKGRETSSEVAWKNINSLRRPWWGRPRLVWCGCDWKDEGLCFLAKLFAINGCSFTFDDAKTKEVWEAMTEFDKSSWPLWATGKTSYRTRAATKARRPAIKALVREYIAHKYHLPAWCSYFFM